MITGFSGKKILFISAKFFGYEVEIKKKLESFGSEVDYYDERPKNDFLTKALIRVNRNLLAKKNSQYYNEIIEETKNRNYDYVFIIKGEVISESNLNKLKEYHPHAKFILYMWDALSYTPNSKKIKYLFDQVLTFDLKDSLTYSDMKFRPLFYIDDYKQLASKKTMKDIDVLFVGTVHTDRFTILKKIEDQLTSSGINYYFYKYYPSKFLFYLKRIFDADLRRHGKKELQFKALRKEDVLELYSRSKVIVDIERPKQNGLTMRTIEVFGAKTKLITTNQSIEKYDLYDPKNIQIINRDNPVIDLEFLLMAYQEAQANIYRRYSIDEWLFELFEISSSDYLKEQMSHS